MEKTLPLLTIFALFLSCEGSGSTKNLDLLVAINDDLLSTLDERSMQLGLPEFMMLSTEQFQKSKSERDKALKTNDLSDYAETLSGLIDGQANKGSVFISGPLNDVISLVKAKKFGSIDIHQLLLVENYLLTKAKTFSFNHYYHADVIIANVELEDRAPNINQEIVGYVYPIAQMSTLKYLTEFDIIDVKTNKIEQQYKLASGKYSGMEFRYKGSIPGDKLIKGSFQILKNGETRIIRFESTFTVR